MSPDEKKCLVAVSGVAEKTLRHYLRGARVKDASRRRIERAAAELQILIEQPPRGDDAAR